MAEQRHHWLEQIAGSAQVRALGERLASARRVVAEGSRGSSTNLLAGALARNLRRPVLLVVAHLDEADDALDDLELFEGLHVERFGALEVLPGETSVSLELLAERLQVVGRLSEGARIDVIVAPVQALMQAVPEPEAAASFTRQLGEGDDISPNALMNWLGEAGYQRQDAIEQPGDFASRGGILDIYPPAGSLAGTDGSREAIGPIRLDFFGDELESIHLIDPDTMGSARRIKHIQLVGASAEQIQKDDRTTSLISLLPSDALAVMHEPMELAEQARGYYERLTNPRGIYAPKTVFQKLQQLPHVEVNQYGRSAAAPADRVALPVNQLPPLDTDAAKALIEIGELVQDDPTRAVVVLCRKPAERDRLRELLKEHAADATDRITIEVGYLHRGFVWTKGDFEFRIPDSGKGTAPDSPKSEIQNPKSEILLLPHHELFHRYDVRRRVRKVISAGTQASDAFLDLDVGDYVVHVDHGIAQFTGLKTLRRDGQSEEYLTLEFADQAKLHVPATQIDLVQKYVGGFEGRPPLSTLGGKRWSRQKEQVREAVKDLAAELLRVHAARETQPGIRYPADTAWQKEFEAEFPYDETDDQLAAIAAIKHDMSEDRPMDRLICGDVGFGKTEVAIRAAFKAIEFGKQVAVLVPTTVLAEQHERTFRQRMADYPFIVESMSRFKTGSDLTDIAKRLSLGQVDIVIGTHRLLSKDVKFADLGLVIIDEEQRFGVEHKNKLLSFRLTADVLTLTATPIPRTLHMSMVGLRDISSLATAPIDRRAIVTEVVPYDEKRIQQAILRELNREGQIYFVHNRVHNIQSVAATLQSLVPEARIAIGHGQMSPRELEKIMLRFIRREVDILVSTTIIESGIDIPTANTMFINKADHFGLAELHQLRGRVGRYKHRAYCYLLLPEDRTINEVAAKRLKAIEQYAMLGAGFKIAMRDLEIRGAGNLLGSEQSGHIAAVGYEMYCVLLEQETKKLKNEPIIQPTRTHLELPAVGALPRRFIRSDKHRMEAYRRLSRATTLKDYEQVVADLKDAYGEPPPTAQTLLDLTELRIAASTLGIDGLKLEGPDLIFTTRQAAKLNDVFVDAPGRVSLIDEKTVYYRPPSNYLQPIETLLAVLRKLLVRPLRQATVPAEG
ncbi:transcription-repair coupling factor [Phycisphaerales bacterium AB-hyl4]|uniref:Transcription-repair-coupling factor n=1 Tax=Natronomicrosphaera hydrolytica TaxID=3242702 RepID=A0ABV4U3V6_9BACT